MKHETACSDWLTVDHGRSQAFLLGDRRGQGAVHGGGGARRHGSPGQKIKLTRKPFSVQHEGALGHRLKLNFSALCRLTIENKTRIVFCSSCGHLDRKLN